MERIRLFVGKIRIARIAEIARNHRNLRNRLQYALIASVCHLDRSAAEILPLQEIFGAEWRDPEEVSSAMQLQGVLPTLPVATRPSARIVCLSDAFCVCHLDPSATEILPLQEIFGAEWRDPEPVSSAMQLQGVLPTLPVATRLGPSDSGDYARLRCDSGDSAHPPRPPPATL